MKQAYLRGFVSVLLALLLILGGSPIPVRVLAESPAKSPAESPVKSSEEPPGVQTEEIGKVRVQVLSDTLARVEAEGPKGYEDRLTYHITNRDWPGARAKRVTEEKITKIVTSNYTVNVPNNATSLNGVYVTNAKGKRIWEYQSLPSGNPFLPAPGSTPEAWAIADNPRVVPAEWGYNPMPQDNTEFTDYNGWDTTNQAPDMYVFLPRRDAKQLRKDFIELTGRTELVPLKALGLWHSRYYQYHEQEVYDTIDKYRDEGFPLDYFVVDTDWRMSNSGTGYDINEECFPDMPQFLRNAHEKHDVNIMFNDHPEPVNNQHALTQEDLQFRNENLRRILDMGLDTWWFDRNWSTSIRSPFSGISKESFGMYLYHYITRDQIPGRRPMIMGNVDGIDNGVFNRAPDLASHRYSIQWTGDTHGQSQDLRQEIVDAVRSGAETLLPYVSADVGGHMDVLSPALYTRWSQYAALSPVFRYHCTANPAFDRSPWLYGAEAENVVRDYVRMRYRLLPVFYSLSRQNYETGLPITKRLDYNYPGYAQAQDNTQYLLGDGILVAPIWEADTETETVPASWLTHDQGAPGLQATFYNNVNLEDPAVLTREDANVNFDWETKSPGTGVSDDNFSAVWEGKITIGEEDVHLATTVDDGVRLYVDGKKVVDSWQPNNSVTFKTEEIYRAGSTHDIRLEYYEKSGNAVIRLEYVTKDQDDNMRSVFLPDGRWIDVWTGEEFTGPKTINVQHTMHTSPIFVRSGSIVPLVKDAENHIGENDWSKVALDVYPSTRLDGKSELYEDDRTTVSYKEGEYRTTALKTTFDKKTGETVVNIGAAKGAYEGSDAYDSRDWKVRVHSPKQWGRVESATLDGKDAFGRVQTIAQTGDAKPFAFEGGAADSRIYELSFKKALDQPSEIRIKFASPRDEDLPGHSDVAVDAEVSERFVGGTVNLSKEGKEDWIHLGAEEEASVTKKADGSGAIGDVAINGEPKRYTNAPVEFQWEGGTPVESTDHMRSGLSIGEGSFDFDVAVGPEEKQIKVYLSGENASGSLAISDGTGTGAQVVPVSGAGQYAKAVVIRAQAEAETRLRISWVKTGGTGPVSLMAVTLADPDLAEDVAVERSASLEPVPADVHLSDEKNLDWIHVGLNSDPAAINRKKDVPQMISPPQTTQSCFEVHDYNTNFSWSDGTPTLIQEKNHNAIATNGSFQISAPSAPEWRELKIYLGCWKGTNTIEISDEAGEEVTSFTCTAGNPAQIRCLSVKYRSNEDSALYVKWAKTDGTGNVSFAACTVSELEENGDNITAQLEEVPDTLNLSDDRFTEWMHFGHPDATSVNRKADPQTNRIVPNTKDLLGKDLVQGIDYKTSFSWDDGTPLAAADSVRDFSYSYDGLEKELNMQPGSWRVSLYTSLWWAKGSIEILDENGALVDILGYESRKAASGTSEYRKVVLDYRSDKAQELTVRVVPALAFDGHRGNMSLAAATVEELDPEPVEKKAPGKPVLSHNNGWDTGIQDGDYTVTMDMWYGVNGTSCKLYENGRLIDTQKLKVHTPAAQTAKTDIRGRSEGTYTYYCELTNAAGTTKSDPITIKVTQTKPGKPSLSCYNDQGRSSWRVTMDMWWGINGTTYKLYENDELIDTQKLTAKTPNAQTAFTDVRDKPAGTYTYYCELINDFGSTKSKAITVKVKE